MVNKIGSYLTSIKIPFVSVATSSTAPVGSSRLSTVSQNILSQTQSSSAEGNISAVPISAPVDAAEKAEEVGAATLSLDKQEPGLLKRAWTILKNTVSTFPNIFAPIGYMNTPDAIQVVPGVIGLVYDGTDLVVTVVQAKRHKDNIKDMVAHQFQHLSSTEMQSVRDTRTEAIKGNGEIEKLFGLKAGEQPDIGRLRQHVEQNTQLNVTQKQLTLTFLESFPAGKAMTYDDFVNRYADHTVAMSIMARGALQTQSRSKMQIEKKIFDIQRDVKAWNFGTSLASAAVWVAMNIVTLTTVSLPASCMSVFQGVGWGLFAFGWGVAAIGVVILAMKKPKTFEEYCRGSFFARDTLNGCKGFLQYCLFYNKRIASLEKKIAELPVEDERRKKLEEQAKTLRSRLEALDRHQAKYQVRIETAGIKDYMAKLGYDRPIQGQAGQAQVGIEPYTSEDFMVELIEIATAEVGGRVDDTLTKDMEYSLASMGITEALEGDEVQRRDQISMGARQFIGAESGMMDEINIKVRKARQQGQLAILEQAIFAKEGEGGGRELRADVVEKLGKTIEQLVTIDNQRADSDPKYRQKVAMRVRQKLKVHYLREQKREEHIALYTKLRTAQTASNPKKSDISGHL